MHHVFLSYIVHVPIQDMATSSSERAQLSFESSSCDEHEPPMPCSFSVGEVFTSYDDLQTKVSLFEKQTFVKLWKRDSRSVEAASKRLNRALSDKLKYYEVTFCCIHGGKKFKAKGEGIHSTK